jgi:N-glycosylase/DNA lyase
MTTVRIPLPRLEHAIREVCNYLHEKNIRRTRWESLSEYDLWRELVACILGSRVKYEVAYSAIERMDKANLFTITQSVRKCATYKQDVIHALLGYSKGQDRYGVQKRYPFYRLRAGQIYSAAKTIYSNGGTVRDLLDSTQDVQEVRRRLVTEVDGLGPKQASLFLRNIGYAAYLAVLDVHVLTYMDWIGLTPKFVESVRTIHQYEMLEDKFIEHSCSSGFPPDRFDLAVWVVVRVVKRDYTTCL